MQKIIGIVYTHENNTLICSTRDYNEAFKTLGFDASVADVSTPEGVQHLGESLLSGEVSFCFGLQGVGSNLKSNDTNLWETSHVPFIGLHYDNPCYNTYNHSNASKWVGNIYFAETFLDIQRRYIGSNQINISLPFRITLPMEPSEASFDKRLIKYLFLKSGETVDEFVQYFDSLPSNLREGVWDITRQLAANPNLVICDLVHTLLISCGYDPATYRSQFWAVVQSLDYYMRRKRAIDMVEWLKMQDGALILGNGWDFIDREGARGEFRQSIPLEDAVLLYPLTKFVINTSPYGKDIVHERIISGLMRNCCVISDSNQWWDNHFGNVPALLRVDMNKPLHDQIKSFVADKPEEHSLTGREPALQQFTPEDNYAHIVACAEQIRQHAK